MDDYSIIDISEWYIHQHFNTKGTREKFIFENSNGFFYYFKKSKDDPIFIHEFWSEIIAYEIGIMLGFPVLKYEPAIFQDSMGCLSQSLIGANEDLVEGLQFLQAYDPNFQVRDKKGRNLYSYQLIEQTLKWIGHSPNMRQVLQMIVFDAVIGNQDRHQENWAYRVVINRNSPNIAAFKEILAVKQKGYDYTAQGFSEYKAYMDVTFNLKFDYTLFYDNGSSLGRELNPTKIKAMLRDEHQTVAYINRGLAEMRWHDKRVTHFELVKLLLTQSGYAWADDIVATAVKDYDQDRLYQILEMVDSGVPDTFAKYRLSTDRKALILKMTSLRVARLAKLL